MIAFLSPLAFVLGWLCVALMVAIGIMILLALVSQHRYERRFERARAERFAIRVDAIERGRPACQVVRLRAGERS